MSITRSEKESRCEVERVNHFDLCTTLDISTQLYFEDSNAEHPGLELCWGLGDSEHFRKFRGSLSRVYAGNVMLFNAREAHSEICSQSPTIPRLRSLILAPEFIDDLLEEGLLEGCDLVWEDSLFPLNGRLKECLDQLFLAKEIPGCSRFSIDSLLTEIALIMICQFEHTQSDRVVRLQRQGEFPALAARTKCFINENLHDPSLTLDSVAEGVGMSKFHLLRTFKREMGITPHAYYRLIRIERAKERLKNTRQSVTEIAYQIGFEDLSTFNKSFKLVTGLTPSKFREAHSIRFQF